MTSESSPERPVVDNIEDAKFWIAVLHRRTVADAEQIAVLMQRVTRLENRRWWRRR